MILKLRHCKIIFIVFLQIFSPNPRILKYFSVSIKEDILLSIHDFPSLSDIEINFSYENPFLSQNI